MGHTNQTQLDNYVFLANDCVPQCASMALKNVEVPFPRSIKERDFNCVEANEALSQFKATARSDRFITETWRSGALRYGFVHLRLSTNAANINRGAFTEHVL
jgi:predicted RNA-binding Zn ribbon-like protein